MTQAATRRPPLDMRQDEFEEWLASEGKSIGGSDVGAVIGVNPYKTPADVWDELVGEVPRSQEDNPHMARGRALEPLVAEQYAHRTGREVQTSASQRFGPGGRYRVSVDRLLYDASGQREGVGVLEIKVPRSGNYRQMRLLGVDPMYQAQLTWYMGWLEAKWGAFAIFNADEWALFEHDVEFSPERFRAMVNAVDSFWTRHVVARVRPGHEEVRALSVPVPRTGGEALAVSGTKWRRLFDKLRATRDALNVAQHAYDLAKAEVQQEMTQDIVTMDGDTIYWNEVTSRRFDAKALRAAHPELDLDPYYRSTVTRPFRPFFRGEES